MTRPTFWIGIALTGGVLIAMAADFASRATSVSVPVLPTPEGFRMNLEGVGPVEIAFAGRVELVTDKREEEVGGGATRVPQWKVNGSDPIPEGAGMAIFDTRIEALTRDDLGDSPMIANTERAWIPLTRDRGLLTLDMNRTWRLADPVLDLPGFRPGTRMTARARGMTELRPREETIAARGPFELAAENLALDAAGFAYDAKTGVVSFEPWQGAVRWSFVDELGRTLRGFSDAGGEIQPREDGSLLLHFAEGERGVRTTIPAGKDLPPATVLARSLDLTFAPGTNGTWQPRSATAHGPLLLSDARIAFEGAGAEIAWSPTDGTLLEARITGPIAAHPWEPPLQIALARDSAVYDAASGSIALDGRAWVRDESGFVSADSLHWNGTALDATGQVVVHGAQGTARADRALASEKSGLAAKGSVRLLPFDGLVEELAGPALTITPEGEAELDGGFLARGRREGVPWTLTGVRIRHTQTEDGASRADAFGDLRWSEPGLRIEGERFKQLDEKSFRFEGGPATVWTTMDTGEEVRGSFRRADYGAEEIVVEGDPWLEIPAAVLGLAGEPIELRARTARRAHADGAWSMDGNVRATGALRSEVDHASWSPTDGLILQRRIAAPVVDGTLADGTTFWVTAREFGINAERVIILNGAAQGRFVQPDGGGSHLFWADYLQASEFGGYAEGSARVSSDLGSGSGNRLEWRAENGELVWLMATGGAHLEREDLVAEGERIEADQETGWVEAEGTADRPAWARLRDGREVRAVWLRYNSRSHLIESGPVRLATPDLPR